MKMLVRSTRCLLAACGGLALTVGTPGLAAVSVFADDFSRVDGLVGNGWSDMIGNTGGNLAILGGKLTTQGVGDRSGIYRGADFSGGAKATATFTQTSGFASLPNRFGSAFVFGTDGSFSSGLQVAFTRGDRNYNDSAVRLIWNDQEIAVAQSTFQFDTSITSTVSVSRNGHVSGTVSENGQTSAFDFSSNAYSFSGSNFGLIQSYPDARGGSPIRGTIDNVSLMARSVSSAPKPLEIVYDIAAYDASKPTVVITHGWQPGGSTPGWVKSMAGDIESATSNLIGSNVIEAYWEDAKTSSFLPSALRQASAHTSYAGQLLANELAALPGTFEGGLQFIGHSLGTHVNAYAANTLTDDGVSVGQFTILDRPFGNNVAQGFSGLESDDYLFRLLLPKDEVEFVDNYYGTNVVSVTPTTGLSFEGTAVARNVQYSSADHLGVHKQYASTIGEYGPCGPQGGFSCSIANSSQFRNPDEKWNPRITSGLLQSVGGEADFSHSGWSRSNCTVISVNTSVCTEGSPAFLWNDIFTFDSAAEFLTFDVTWLALGDGDWITVFFDDTLLYTFAGTAAIQNVLRSSGLISVRHLAGRSGYLEFALNSVGEKNASFSISNLRTLASAGSVPEPNVWIMLICGFFTVGYAIRVRSSQRFTTTS